MLDTAALSIINVNIDSIEAEGTLKKENCNANINYAKMYNVRQEMHGAMKCCTNTNEDVKNTNNTNGSDSDTNTNALKKLFPVITKD